jgi:hypothetical protein
LLVSYKAFLGDRRDFDFFFSFLTLYTPLEEKERGIDFLPGDFGDFFPSFRLILLIFFKKGQKKGSNKKIIGRYHHPYLIRIKCLVKKQFPLLLTITKKFCRINLDVGIMNKRYLIRLI